MRVLFSVLVFCLIGVPLASADSGNKGRGSGKAPDSILTCEAAETTYRPLNLSVPAAISVDPCSFSNCSTCIRSLETQGCKVVQTVVSLGSAGSDTPPGSRVGGTVGRSEPRVTFLLSCAKP